MRATGIPIDGAALTLIRKQRGLSREELAERAGVPVSIITRIENGERRPKARTVRALCEVLGCTPAGLMPG